MASSGEVRIETQSVDWPYPYTRGHARLTNVVGWAVNDQGYISFWSISSSDNVRGTWGICGTRSGYGVHLEPQVSYNGGASWETLDSPFHEAAICSQLTNTIAISKTLIGRLGSYKLRGDCSLRFLYYANRNPAPSQSLPNAFPNSSYSAEVQVPVHVDVSWKATINYNANGGSPTPPSQSKTVSTDTATMNVSSMQLTRDNHRFDGWSYSSTAQTPDFVPGQSITINKGNPTVTLYAVWIEYYRPGQRKINNTWKSLNRDGGGCDRKGYGEMKTCKGGIESSDPPLRKDNGTWYNMKRIGAE